MVWFMVSNVQIHCNIETSVHQTDLFGKNVLTKICSSYDQYFKVNYLFVRLCCQHFIIVFRTFSFVKKIRSTDVTCISVKKQLFTILINISCCTFGYGYWYSDTIRSKGTKPKQLTADLNQIVNFRGQERQITYENSMCRNYDILKFNPMKRQPVPLVEQELPTLPEHLSSSRF